MIRLSPAGKGIKMSLLILTLTVLTPGISGASSFKVAKVYSGDTIAVSCRDDRITVRLAGIDAPEICGERNEFGQPYSKEAKAFLSREILGKTIDIEGYGHGRHDLLLGVVYLNGKNVNLRMLQAGLAEVYQGRNPKNLDLKPFRDAEKKASEDKEGMWSQGDAYLSPRAWRKKVKAKSACAIFLYGICNKKGQ